MKNRILCRLMSFGTAILLALGTAECHPAEMVYGAAVKSENVQPVMTQRAYWTDKENFYGELEIEIDGLKELLNAYTDNDETDILEGTDIPIENPEENPSVPSPTPLEIPSVSGFNEEENRREEETDKDTDIQKTEQNTEELPESDCPEKSQLEESQLEEQQLEEEHSEGKHPGEEPSWKEESSDQNISYEENTEGETGKNSGKDSGKERDFSLSGEQNNPLLASGLTAVSAVGRQKVGNNTGIRADRAAVDSGRNYYSACNFENADLKIPEVILVTRLSGYFQTDEEKLPKGSIVKEVLLPGEDGTSGEGTEIICPISQEDFDKMQETVIIKIPLILKKEFLYCETARVLPVLHPIEAELKAEDNTGTAGTFLIMSDGSSTKILSKAKADITLETAATPADYTLSIKADQEKAKAGQPLKYEITIANTGEQPLPLISLEYSMKPSELGGTWISEEKQETDISGRKAILTNLKKGEIRQLTFLINLPESQSEPVVSTITAKAQKTTDSSDTLIKGTSLKTEVTALKADFSVNKSADRTTAAPGDTITYQICIRNTGERTLHSVLSTERFQAEEISARFVEKEGVVLNSSKTQALISEIPPGEVFSLEALVTLPEKLNRKELINQVVVRTKETGDKTMQSTSEVKILETSPSASTTEEPLNLYGGSGTAGGGSSSVSDYPKTSDDSNMPFWGGLLLLSVLSGTVLTAVLKAKSKH